MSMLKFSVVHAPVSPLGDHGLTCDDQAVPEALYSGIEEFPYGEAGISSVPGSKIKDIKKKNKKRVAGVDFDGTITIDPRSFKGIIDSLRQSGCECHVVTGRHSSEAGAVSEFLGLYGIKVDSVKCCPVGQRHSVIDVDPLLARRVANWKADTLEAMAADIMIDDSFVYASVIAKRLPGIVILRPVFSGL